jgi:hypothetical protein
MESKQRHPSQASQACWGWGGVGAGRAGGWGGQGRSVTAGTREVAATARLPRRRSCVQLPRAAPRLQGESACCEAKGRGWMPLREHLCRGY